MILNNAVCNVQNKGDQQRYFVFKDGLMSYWDKSTLVDRTPPHEQPLHVWKTCV